MVGQKPGAISSSPEGNSAACVKLMVRPREVMLGDKRPLWISSCSAWDKTGSNSASFNPERSPASSFSRPTAGLSSGPSRRRCRRGV